MKVRTGISMDDALLCECDKYCVDNDISRSDLIEQSVRLYLSTRAISNKTDVLVPEQECIFKTGKTAVSVLHKSRQNNLSTLVIAIPRRVWYCWLIRR